MRPGSARSRRAANASSARERGEDRDVGDVADQVQTAAHAQHLEARRLDQREQLAPAEALHVTAEAPLPRAGAALARQPAPEAAWIALARDVCVQHAARDEHAPDLREHARRIVQVLEHVEQQDRVELAVARGQRVMGREPHVDFGRDARERRERAAAHVRPREREPGPRGAHGAQETPRAAAHLEDAAALGQKAQRFGEPVARDRAFPGMDRLLAPARRLVVEAVRPAHGPCVPAGSRRRSIRVLPMRVSST